MCIRQALWLHTVASLVHFVHAQGQPILVCVQFNWLPGINLYKRFGCPVARAVAYAKVEEK